MFLLVLGSNVSYSKDTDLRLNRNQAVTFAVENSFDVRLAKLDYLAISTDIKRVEAMFDTMLSGSYGYSEDKRAKQSAALPTYTILNEYNAEIEKKLPTGTDLALRFSNDRNWNNATSSTINPAAESQLMLDIRQPVVKNMFGMNDRAAVSITKLTVQNASLTEKDNIEQTIAEVENSYWQWVLRHETLQIYSDMFERANHLQTINKKNYDIGRIEKGDFIASEANVVIRENEVEKEIVVLKNSEETLKMLMNMDAAINIVTTEKMKYKKPKVSLEECLRVAFEKRRDYEIAKRDVDKMKIELKMNANERWPEVDFVATLGANGINSNLHSILKKVEHNENTYYYTGVEVSFSLENKDAISNYERAKYDKETAIVTLKKIERGIFTQVGNVYREYILNSNLLEKLIHVANLQKDKLDEEMKQFNYGRSTTKRIIDYQREYLLAQLNVVLGIYEYEASKINLERTMNILLDKYEVLL